jgi:hypothetical protein
LIAYRLRSISPCDGRRQNSYEPCRFRSAVPAALPAFTALVAARASLSFDQCQRFGK